jgi:hypothetical protein
MMAAANLAAAGVPPPADGQGMALPPGSPIRPPKPSLKGAVMTLQEISDRMELQELMVAYCYAIDRRDWDALDDIFTQDATIDYSEMVGFRGTLAETKQFLAASMQQIAASQHIISTSQISIEGDTAHGRTVCTNPMVLHPSRHTMFVGLWYRDVFVRTPRGWRIQSRYEERCWTFNTPEGLLAPEGS